MSFDNQAFTLFCGHRLVARGALESMARRAKATVDAGEDERLALFDDRSGIRVDLDLRGSADEVVARLADHPLFAPKPTAPAAPRGRGRPKLGVVSREVSLLPRHWDWLAAQRGGASAALRRLVDAARRGDPSDTQRSELEAAAHRFMWDMAGDLAGFEEATRAFFARDYQRFERSIATWPPDIAAHLMRYVEALRALLPA